jgi:hypothetical protein
LLHSAFFAVACGFPAIPFGNRYVVFYDFGRVGPNPNGSGSNHLEREISGFTEVLDAS